MELIELKGEAAIFDAMQLVESFLEDPEQRIYFITGYYGIGKRTALKELFDKKGIQPIIHNYTQLSDPRPILQKLSEFEDKIHLWDDVFYSNLNPKVMRVLQDLAQSKTTFKGKFILVANDQEFPNLKFPDLPGVWINISNADMISIIRIRQYLGKS